MANMFDYLEWRGDLSFKDVPFNEIDNLIFCELSYLDFSGIIDVSFSNGIAISEIVNRFASSEDFDKKTQTGMLINPKAVDLLFASAKTKRFKDCIMCAYNESIDEEKEQQFSALTFSYMEKQHFIAFRGTDDSLVGWKEDFNMAFLSTVPSQLEATAYCNKATASLRGSFILGGHSKGGNLAAYAAANASKNAIKKIKAVYNNDGPGFQESVVSQPNYQRMVKILHTFIPHSSIIGLLLEQEEDYTIVESTEIGLMQHDPFSWQIKGQSFIQCSKLSDSSIFVDKTLKSWLSKLPPKDRELFIDTFFDVLEKTKAKTLSDLSNNWLKSAGTILRSFSEIDSQSRNTIIKAFQLLIQVASSVKKQQSGRL